MIRRAVVLTALVVAACDAQPSSSSSPSPTVALASPTATPAATVARPASPSPTPTLIPLPSFTELSPAGGSVVWAFVAGTRLFRSTDRGDAWTERPVPPQPVNGEITFIDDHEGWFASLATPAAQCTTQLLALSHTADAGTTWQTVTTSGIAAEQCKESPVFSDAQHGSLVAWDPNSPPLIYRTSDGGRTWDRSRLPDPPGFVTRPAGFTLHPGAVRTFGSMRLVAAIGLTDDQQPPQRLYVFASTDEGATWSYASTAPNALGDVAFVSATRWLQITSGGDWKETTDAGGSWHTYATTYSQAAPIGPAIVFGDAQTGYATVRGTIQRTVDGGAHWTSIRTPGTF